jgi:2-oxoisovalerate dehydrogenase E1 component alpha subunit
MARKNGVAGEQERAAAALITSGDESLPAETCLHIHQIMVRARTMEERMIKMSKSGQGFFWIGGPGEEAFNTCLGLLVKKGEGPQFDYLHLHYRNSACLVAMGMTVLDGIRQMAMKVTDPHSMGRNFSSHFARKDWNILPVKSVIQSQFVIAPGTARVQKRLGGEGITIVIGGDAGTAEGDFASCMVWSTRPGNELPVLMIVTNNGWGISTPASTQHGEQHITDRGRAFGIQGEVVNGNDPIASWHALQRAMGYVRNMRRPYMLEARLSRLHGHSSSSGAARVANEPDCIALLEKKLLDAGVIDRPAIAKIHEMAEHEAEQALEQALREPDPTPDDVPRHTYADSPVDAVYPGDYTGLPG